MTIVLIAIRFASYTSKANTAETAPLLIDSNPASTPKSSKLGMLAKVAPTAQKIHTTNMSADATTTRSLDVAASSSNSKFNYRLLNASTSGNKATTDERADNKQNENTEKRKKEEKSKLRAEKEARKVWNVINSCIFSAMILTNS